MTIFLLLIGSLALRAENDFQYWSRFQVKVIDTKYVDSINFWDLRFFDDSSNFGFWQTSQKIQVDLIRNLSLGVAYTYLDNEVANEFKYQHRLELETNPYWSWKEWVNIRNCNRVEFRWIEDKGSDNGRFRQLLEFEVPIKNISPVQSLYFNNEIFIDFNQKELNENRVVPFGITFKVYKKTSFKVSYMIQSKKTAHDWLSNQVLGTHLLIAF